MKYSVLPSGCIILHYSDWLLISLRQQTFDYLLKVLERLRPEDCLTVDQESRGACDAHLACGISLRLHKLSVFTRIEALVESCAVQTKLNS